MIYRETPDRIEGILIDFDGVISPNSIPEIVDFLFGYFQKHYPLDREFLLDYVRLVSPFSAQKSIFFLFDSLGLNHLIDDFAEKFSAFEQSGGSFSLAPDFLPFLDFLDDVHLEFKVFSLAGPERLNRYDGRLSDKIYPLTGSSKADTKTFDGLRGALSGDLSRWVYLDDNPLALYLGKTYGLTAVFMKTPVYGEKVYPFFLKNIEFTVNSFKELQVLLKNQYSL